MTPGPTVRHNSGTCAFQVEPLGHCCHTTTILVLPEHPVPIHTQTDMESRLVNPVAKFSSQGVPKVMAGFCSKSLPKGFMWPRQCHGYLSSHLGCCWLVLLVLVLVLVLLLSGLSCHCSLIMVERSLRYSATAALLAAVAVAPASTTAALSSQPCSNCNAGGSIRSYATAPAMPALLVVGGLNLRSLPP